MAARKLSYLIFFTIVGCCFNVIILGVSFGTKNWYVSKAIPSAQNSSASTSYIDVHYGLFTGSKTTTIKGSEPLKRDLKLTCWTQKNVCMYSCGTTKSNRMSDIDYWFSEGVGNETHSDTALCQPQSTKTNTLNPLPKVLLKKDGQIKPRYTTDGPASKSKFLNYGLWLTTVIFLCGGILFSAISGSLALFNTFRAPSQPILSVFGLYIWNGLAAFCSLMTLILYGAAFQAALKKECAISDTIGSNYSTTEAKLGYSFWILMLAEFISLANIGILRYRTWTIYKRETTVRVIDDKITSPEILLY